MSKRKKRATVSNSSNGSVTTTTNGDSSRRGKAFESHTHENNWCFLDLAVQGAMNSSVKDSSMVEARRISPRKLQSPSQWTEKAKEVACALSVYFFGVDSLKNTIILPPELPQDEKRKKTIADAFEIIHQWRKQLNAGTPVEYFDCRGIQKATVDQRLNGVDSKGFQVPILSETSSLEDYSLKQEDIAIKLSTRQHWLIFSPLSPITKDIGIVPEGSFRILAEASNGNFDMQEAEEEEDANSKNSEDRTAEEYATISPERKMARVEPSTCNGNSVRIHESKPIPTATSSTRVGKKRGRKGSAPSIVDTCPDTLAMEEEQTLERISRELKATEANASNTNSEQPNEKKQAATTKKTKSNSKGSTKSRTNDFTWICALCHEAECQLFTASSATADNNTSPKVEENDLDFLVICEGPCNRAFHILCATPGRTLPFSVNEEWKCKDCIASQHACCLCGEYGEDNKDVWCCNRKDCGLFFHERCLAMGAFFPEVQIRHVPMDSSNSKSQEEAKNDDDDDDSGEVELGGKATTTVKFACPAHHCWTCDDGNAFGPKSGPLFRCLYCPNAYHSTCIPPSAKFHELALLCHDHSKTHKLPDLDVTNSMQAELEKDAQVKIDKINRKKEKEEQHGNNIELLLLRHQQRRGVETIPFFKSLNLRELQKNESPFLLPVDFRDEVYAKPPDYNHIQSLQYDKTFRPKRREPSGESCQCHLVYKSTSCGQGCINRITYQECVGNPNTSVGEKHKYWNCEIGIECGNRMIGRKQSARVKVKRQVGKGFGLTVVDGVKRGCLVQEYVGDVINEDTKKQRLADWAKENPNDQNFYMMQLEPGWYIDARERGNLSRFVNHSCEPNCELVPKNVAGYMRMAIIAMKDIEPGGFLSYDYQFETNQAERFACRCGAKSCRGSLMGNFGANKGNTEEKKNKKQLLIEAKARVERDQKFLEEYKSSKMKRLNQVGLLVPSADHRDGSETVFSGPQWKHRHCSHIFLWRNAIACSDWNQRLERHILQRRRLWPKPKLLDIGPPRNTLTQIKEWNEKVKSA